MVYKQKRGVQKDKAFVVQVKDAAKKIGRERESRVFLKSQLW